MGLLSNLTLETIPPIALITGAILGGFKYLSNIKIKLSNLEKEIQAVRERTDINHKDNAKELHHLMAQVDRLWKQDSSKAHTIHENIIDIVKLKKDIYYFINQSDNLT